MRLLRWFVGLSREVAASIVLAIGGVVGVALMFATSDRVSWYWGIIGVAFAAVCAKYWKADRRSKELD